MQTTPKAALAAALLAGISLSATRAHAGSTELITNGGFETGGYTGWTTITEVGSSGALGVVTGNTAPKSFYATAGPARGTFYSISDQNGPGAYSLEQNFTVTPGSKSVILSFDQFVNEEVNVVLTPPTLDATSSNAPPNERARVDILRAGADPFSVSSSDVLANFYDGADPIAKNPNPYTHYSFDITSLVGSGGTFTLRFAEADNQGNFQQGVDNVSIMGTPPIVPEASTTVSMGLLLALGMGGLALTARRRKAGASS